MVQHFEDLDLAQARSVDELSYEQLQDVRALIAADLGQGRDAWPAVTWLAATNDERAKQHILGELTAVIKGASSELLNHEAAVDNFGSDIVFGRAARDRRRISRAFDFATALGSSAVTQITETVTDLPFEEEADKRRRITEDQEAKADELNRLGVEPGSGLPFWEMYMRRRRHKNWGKGGH